MNNEEREKFIQFILSVNDEDFYHSYIEDEDGVFESISLRIGPWYWFKRFSAFPDIGECRISNFSIRDERLNNKFSSIIREMRKTRTKNELARQNRILKRINDKLTK